MLIIATGILLWSPAVLGYGSLLFRLPPLSEPSMEPPRLVYRAAAGFLVMAAIANLANFFLPLSPTFAQVALLIGWALFLFFLLRGQPRSSFRSSIGWLAAGAFLLAYITCIARFQTNGDTGLYYLQTIRWLRESPVPLGLANLHGRLGYNSAWHSVAALLEIPYFVGKSSFLLNSTLLFLFGLSALQAAWDLWKRRFRPGNVFLALCAIPLFSPSMYQYRYASSASANGSVIFLELLAVAAFFDATDHQHSFPRGLWTSLMVTALALLVKISALPVVILPLALLVWKRKQLSELRKFRLAIVALGLLLVPWLGRGVALSGCLAYPVRATCLPVGWRVSEQIRWNEEMSIRSWARWPKQDYVRVLSSWDWLGPWFMRYRTNQTMLAVSGFTGLSLLLSGWAFWKRKAPVPPVQWAAILMPAAGLLYWFLSAPDIRFGEGYFWAFSFALLVFAFSPMLAKGLTWMDQGRNVMRMGALIGGLVVLIMTGAVVRGRSLSLGKHLFVWPEMRSVEVLTLYTQAGVPIYKPASRDKCWDHPVPCTPYFSDTLEVELGSSGRPVKFIETSNREN